MHGISEMHVETQKVDIQDGKVDIGNIKVDIDSVISGREIIFLLKLWFISGNFSINLVLTKYLAEVLLWNFSN